MISRNDPCWCGSEKKWKKCHYPHHGHVGDLSSAEYRKQYGILIKSPEQIAGIRRAGHLAAKILDAVCAKAVAGVTTQELDDYAMKLHAEAGAIPAPLGYGHPPFPRGICTSINEVICHGIPGPTVLNDGDIINIDVTSILNGYYGDCSQMVVVGGKTTPERQLVVDVAHDSLMHAIAILKPGVHVCAIGNVIQEYAEGKGCSVVYQFVGHGVGVDFHEAPQIQHCSNNCAIPLAAGMTFTIEPMINAGVPDAVVSKLDQWTAITADRRASAQWEHTLLITETGVEILTPWVRK